MEVRFAGAPLDDQAMDALHRRFVGRYPAPPQQANNIDFQFAGTVLRMTQQNLGMQILSADGTFTVVLGRGSLATSRNAPYAGWEDFTAEARRNWSDWVRVVGWKDVSRIGVRYINRIDIPFGSGGTTNLGDFFRFFVTMPKVPGFEGLNGFAAQAEFPMSDSPVKLVINHAPTPSPLVETNSFLLDLDLAVEQDLPSNEKGLWDIIEALRSIKNSVFEACITDKTRELFS